MTVTELRRAIKRLPSDPPVHNPRKWYRTQKEHWIGWLNDYDTPGAYNRKTTSPEDAQGVYNRIVEPKMLLWLAEAAGVDPSKVGEAKRQAGAATSMMQASGRVRRLIPWQDVQAALTTRGRGRFSRLVRRR